MGGFRDAGHSVVRPFSASLLLQRSCGSYGRAKQLSVPKEQDVIDRVSYWCGADGDYDSSLEVHAPQLAEHRYAHVLCS
jgi:hypothetical protein